MGIDLYAKKGEIELCFGRAYCYKESGDIRKIEDLWISQELVELESDRDRTIEELKGYVKYSPTSIEDADKATIIFEDIIAVLQKKIEIITSLTMLQELVGNGFKLIEK